MTTENDDCPFLDATPEQLASMAIYKRLDGDPVGYRIMNRRKVNGECWEYQGWDNGSGYKKIRVCGRGEYVHRYVFNLFNDRLMLHQEVGHICLNRSCFRPTHLKRETPLTNMREMNKRMWKKRK
jgi:hypothetical protein